MTRLEANLEILEILNRVVKDNPDLRFGQVLSLLSSGPIAIFYVESTESLAFLQDNLRDLKLI